MMNSLRRAMFSVVALMAFVPLLPVARAQKLLNFEGIQAGGFPRTFYNGGFDSSNNGPGPNLGVVFPLTGIECTVTNFGNLTTTPPNALTPQESDTCYFNVSAGFTGSLSFYYASLVAQPKAVTVFEGLDRSGAVLAQVDLPAQSPDFVRFVIAFSGTARSVSLHGFGVAFDNVQIGSVQRITYSSHLNIGDSLINLTNTGENLFVTGNICANFYTFSPDEQLVSCCSCVVTPNALASLSVQNDLISNTLTPAHPTSVVVKVVASAGPTCNAATVGTSTNAIVDGIGAWMTTLHALPTAPVTYGLTEHEFAVADLSGAELTHITSYCGFIQANGSGFGICRSCRLGGLGAVRQ
jgi:hypothetical protein